MSEALDFAKIFIKKELDTHRNTYDGNMKLQKLLFFANFVSLAEKNKPLYNDAIYAFSNGCVVESVRLRYKNDYDNLYRDSLTFNPNFTQDEYDVINLTAELFGGLSAKELSDINHTFDFWSTALNRSIQSDGYKNKELAKISNDEMLNEISKLQVVIEQFKINAANRAFREIINGVNIYYTPDLCMTDEILEQLENFSKEADETSYSVYIEEGNLIIF